MSPRLCISGLASASIAAKNNNIVAGQVPATTVAAALCPCRSVCDVLCHNPWEAFPSSGIPPSRRGTKQALEDARTNKQQDGADHPVVMAGNVFLLQHRRCEEQSRAQSVAQNACTERCMPGTLGQRSSFGFITRLGYVAVDHICGKAVFHKPWLPLRHV